MARMLRISLIAFCALWFGVIVPGHQRGVVKLPGVEADGAAAHNCCTVQGSGASNPSDESAPRQDPGKHCAICYIAGLLQDPATLHMDLPPLAFVSHAATMAPALPLLPAPRATHHGRAPPFARV